MTGFTTRVELHEAVSTDYTKLHTAMQAKGFSRTITSDKGVTYHLPTAEYLYSGTQTRAGVLELAKAAAATVRPKFAVLVTEANGRTWHGLAQV